MKERLDVLLVKHGLAESREKAKAIIISGIVYVDGHNHDNPGTNIDEKTRLNHTEPELKNHKHSRLKIEKAKTH